MMNRLISLLLPIYFLVIITTPQVIGGRLPSADESLKSTEGQLLGNSLLAEFDRQQEPHLSYYPEQLASDADLLQQEYEEGRAYDQLVTALQQQMLYQLQQQQQHPIRVVRRSRILYPEDLTSEVRHRLNASRRFPPPPSPAASRSRSVGNISRPQSSDGHEQQKRPESSQRLISGSGVSGLANFLTQSYGLGKDGSIGVRFGLS